MSLIFSKRNILCYITSMREMFCPIGLSHHGSPGAFISCGGGCLSVSDDKIYKCSVGPHISRFNDFFSEKIPLGEDDFISLSDVNRISQLIKMHENPSSLCNHCVKRMAVPWRLSKKEKSEWFVETGE
jgi:hypothetical protein